MSTPASIFCPRCATENSTDLKYCRQCGLEMSGIQWVLAGNVPDAQKRLEAAEKWTKAGNTILIGFISVAVAITILGFMAANTTLGVIAMVGVFIGAVLAFPFTFAGNSKLAAAKRVLSEAGVSRQIAIEAKDKKSLPVASTSELPPV